MSEKKVNKLICDVKHRKERKEKNVKFENQIFITTGWDKQSYGYHGDDGNSFCSSGNGQPYGPTFTTGKFLNFFGKFP